MSINTINLVLALYYEHRQRTRHDCQVAIGNTVAAMQMKLATIPCDVCLFLGPLMKEAEAASCPPEPDEADAMLASKGEKR
jgi:hypothetical protein